jgi:hypothetical protein
MEGLNMKKKTITIIIIAYILLIIVSYLPNIIISLFLINIIVVISTLLVMREYSKNKSIKIIELIEFNLLWIISFINYDIAIIVSNMVKIESAILIVILINFVVIPFALFFWLRAKAFKNSNKILFWLFKIIGGAIFIILAINTLALLLNSSSLIS